MRPVLLLALIPCVACGPSVPEPRGPRSTVLVVVDTLRADAMGLYGHEHDTTPRLDRLARRRGVVFERARSTASWTKASMASILTGLDPRHHQVTLHTSPLHPARRTLAEAFAEAGFQTAAVQSNIYLHGAFGFSQGFEHYQDEELATYSEPIAESVHARTLAWLDEERDPSRPFFLYVHHYEPHHGYLEDGAPYYRGRPGEEDDEAWRERQGLLVEATMDELVGAEENLDGRDAAFLRARYDAEVRYQDEWIGALFDALEERGLLDEVVLAFTSDHGEEFLEHGGVSHKNDKLYEELLWVPLVLFAPGERARRVASPVSLVDLGRTLLDLAGAARVDFPGESLYPWPRSTDPPRPFFAHGAKLLGEVSSETRAVVVGDYKLVRDGRGTRLYDLARDPLEERPLSLEEGAAAGRARDLDEALEEFLQRNAALAEPLDAAAIEYPDDVRDELEKMGYTGGGG